MAKRPATKKVTSHRAPPSATDSKTVAKEADAPQAAASQTELLQAEAPRSEPAKNGAGRAKAATKAPSAAPFAAPFAAPSAAPSAAAAATTLVGSAASPGGGQDGSALWQDLAALNEELTSFAQRRLQMNVERNGALTQCRSLEDLYKVQTDFASSSTRQYIDESGRLMALMTKLMLDCWTPAQPTAAQRSADLSRSGSA